MKLQVRIFNLMTPVPDYVPFFAMICFLWPNPDVPWCADYSGCVGYPGCPHGLGPARAFAHMSLGPHGPEPIWAQADVVPSPHGPSPNLVQTQMVRPIWGQAPNPHEFRAQANFLHEFWAQALWVQAQFLPSLAQAPLCCSPRETWKFRKKRTFKKFVRTFVFIFMPTFLVLSSFAFVVI